MKFNIKRDKMTREASFYNDPEICFKTMTQTTDKFGLQDLPHVGGAFIGCWEFGGKIKWPEGEFAQSPDPLEFPVKTEEDVWRLEKPDSRKAGHIPIEMEVARMLDKSGSRWIECFIQGPMITAGNICGLGLMLKWMIKAPEAVHRLMRLSTDFLVDVGQLWADTFGGERMIIFGADVSSNQLISTKHFEEFIWPYAKEMQERVLATGINHIHMHICGDQEANLPLWSQVPMGSPGMVSFGPEVDLDVASRYFPDTIIMGNADPAKIQTGTPEDVYELTKACILKGRKHPGGYMLVPGCELPPKAPDDNVYAMLQAVSDFGWFD
jgi:uroporphyrinogen decarboxylase